MKMFQQDLMNLNQVLLKVMINFDGFGMCICFVLVSFVYVYLSFVYVLSIGLLSSPQYHFCYFCVEYKYEYTVHDIEIKSEV